MNFSTRLELISNQTDPDQSLGKLDSLGSVKFDTEQAANPLNISFAYDKKAGILSLVLSPDNIIQATGFITESMVGTGLRGGKGKRGRDGKNGRLGYDGKTGKTGCVGLPGKKGKKGLSGKDGEDGPIGPIGYAGPIGEDGEDGEDGDKGIIGHEGSRGLTGSSCWQGEEGIQGPKPFEFVHFSPTPPNDLTVYLWAQPVEISVDPTTPAIPQTPMSGSIESKSMNVPTVGSGWYQGTLYFNLSSFQGGTGPFIYKWSGDYSGKLELVVVDTGEASQNLNLRCRLYLNETTVKRLEGKVYLEITDSSNGQKLNLEANYSFIVQATLIVGGGGGGGGGGCILYGQKVLTVTKKNVLIENVLLGDSLLGCDIKGVPDSSGGSMKYFEWSTTNLIEHETDVYVRKADHSTHNVYYEINGDLCLTGEEALLVCRNEHWRFLRVVNIKIGDLLKHIDGTKKITEIKKIEKDVKVVSLDVESIDMFYVNGYVIHNKEALDAEYKQIEY
jgi:hypothetical protein